MTSTTIAAVLELVAGGGALMMVPTTMLVVIGAAAAVGTGVEARVAAALEAAVAEAAEVAAAMAVAAAAMVAGAEAMVAVTVAGTARADTEGRRLAFFRCESQDLICQTLSDELPFDDRQFVRAAPNLCMVAPGAWVGRAVKPHIRSAVRRRRRA